MMATKKRRLVRQDAERITTGVSETPMASSDARSHDMPASVTASDPVRRRITPDWRWRSFPVFAALVVGVLIGSLTGEPANTAGQVLRVAALLGFGYVLAHLFVTNVIVAGRIRRRRKAIARGEIPEEDFVEEAVYPEERSS